MLRLRKHHLILVLFLSLFLQITSVLTVNAQSTEKSLVWDRFDVDIVVNKDGTLDISEHQTIRFTQGTFTFGFRDLPVRYFSHISDWSMVDSQQNAYGQTSGGKTPYTFTVEDDGYHYVVRWYFPEISSAAETYTLRYKVHGALRFYEKGDQVWWKAIYGDRSFPVLAGRVRVVVPEGATIGEWSAYVNEADARDSAHATLIEGKQAVIFELDRRLYSGEEFEVRTQFPHGVVDGVPSAWQERADAEAAERDAAIAFQQLWGPWATLGFGGLGLLLFFGGPAALYALWYRLGRDKPAEMVADYLPEPPDELTPGLAGVLLDETVDMQDVIATLVDLARRKVISITEEKQEGFFSNSYDFIYRRELDDVAMQPYEGKLLSAIFGGRDEVRLSELKNKFFARLPGVKSAMYEATVAANLFPKNPETTRTLYMGLGIAGLVGAVVLAILLAALFGSLTGAAILPGVGLGVTAIGLLILAHSMPRKTDHGADVAARWRAFKQYLQDIDKYSDLQQQKTIWDRWLPYAIAFGIDKQYIRKFEAVEAPAPGWYIPSPEVYGPYRRRYYTRPWVVVDGNSTQGEGGQSRGGDKEGGSGGGLGDLSRTLGGGLSGMSAGLGAMLTSAGNTFTSRPQPAPSSSGSGWSGSGGGWSGGGSSGGGGGGGGSGGFG